MGNGVIILLSASKEYKATKEMTVAVTFAQSQRAALTVPAGDEVLQSKRQAERKAAGIAEDMKKKS